MDWIHFDAHQKVAPAIIHERPIELYLQGMYPVLLRAWEDGHVIKRTATLDILWSDGFCLLTDQYLDTSAKILVIAWLFDWRQHRAIAPCIALRGVVKFSVLEDYNRYHVTVSTKKFRFLTYSGQIAF